MPYKPVACYYCLASLMLFGHLRDQLGWGWRAFYILTYVWNG